MKSLTASEARKDWFRLLDEVAAGEVIEVRRRGQRIVIRREPSPGEGVQTPDYGPVYGSSPVDEADRWGWGWEASGLAQGRDRV
ncbi:MAG: hypothetical protein HY319_26895 [Armatimonadetes bacterium]|nr:hypothetical protein [Armatimonadota bacterium]